MSSASNLYSQGFGTTSSASFPGNAIIQTRAPADTDIKGPQGNYVIGQLWVDTDGQHYYGLVGLSPSAGIISATWIQLG